jgi:Domain of unknown function (DUF3883)
LLDITSDGTTTINKADYRLYVNTLAARKIKGFCGTIDGNGAYYSEVYPGNASLAESITADYHGRFLIELIQNANDVHPNSRSDGEIEAVFDRTLGEYGTLFIANRGGPFSQENVNALCDMGLSSKPPGESIGNKGLGFRSVHHITDRPLIYSQSEVPTDTERFGGYCFGFADDEDLDNLITDSRHRILAHRDLPLFHVPKWLDHQSEAIRRFARRGFATVISLPLRDTSASEAVEKEISAIRSQTVPMLLFLTRLERLTIRTVAADGDANTDFCLTRSERPIAAANVALAIVDLGEGGRFLVARRQVPEESMKAAIKEGTDRKQLHKHWLKWEGSGEVALAVRLGDEIATPRLYTFLPMGEQAAAPFSGYLHGSFFPTSNRKALDASIRLNGLLLDEATTLAALTIVSLTENDPSQVRPLDESAKACAVVDLLSWRKVESLETNMDLAAQVAQKVAVYAGRAMFDDAPIIPCLGPESGKPSIVWSTPARSRYWPYELPTFSANIAAAYTAETEVAPIWPGLGKRLDRLSAYLARHSTLYQGFPTPAERAALAARVALNLWGNRRMPIELWSAFYRDLAFFLERAGGALAGHRLLLCADGALHLAMTPAAEVETLRKVKRRRRKGDVVAAVFAPPARRGAGQNDDDQLTPPDSLAENFAFLSNQLDWHGELGQARLFLENAKLVFAFNGEVVLAQLSRLVRQDGRNSIRAAGLRWAFQIWRQPRESGRSFKLQPQHRFFVPSLSGEFIDASEAVFSDTWPEETHGRLLQRFLNSAPPDIQDMEKLRSRRLAARSHYVFKGSRSGQLWIEFLIELGVQEGLRPIAKKVPGTIPAYRLENFSFCNDIGITEQAAKAWKAGIEESNPGATRLQWTTEYMVRGDVWWMPGQGNLDQFSRDCLEHYAMLIIAWLESRHLPTWTIEVHHYHFSSADTRNWPTPVAAFLRSASWIPADEPSAEGTRPVAVRPSEIWLAPEGGTERFPSFLRRPTAPIMRALDRSTPEQIKVLRSRTLLRVLNQTETLLEQAEFLAQQYDSEGFDRYFERHFLNLYNRTWGLLADRVNAGGIALDGRSGPQTLVVHRGSHPEVVRIASVGANLADSIYVRDRDDETVASLVEASGRLLFDPRAGNPTRIGTLLRKLYGDKVRLLSEAKYSMVADGGEVGTGDVAPVLTWCPRLRVFVAIAIEALKGAELQRLPADRSSIVAKLDHVLLQRASTISFQIDSVEVVQEIEDRRAFALKLPNGQPIVVVHAVGSMSWGLIEESLDAICEAIDQPALDPYLHILLLGLANSGKPVGEVPPIELELDWLCGLLRLNENGKRSVRETLGARLERLVPWLRAIIHMGGGSAAVDAFAQQETAAVKDIARFREALSPWLQALELDVDAVLEACKTKLNIPELREALDLDFQRLNESLVAVGERPDTYPELQASIVANHVHENELAIIDRLRCVHAEKLMNGEPAWAYRDAREAVRNLAPDPDWLLRYKEVPVERVAEHVAAWLKTKGAEESVTGLQILRPLDEVRRLNGAAILRFVAAANPLIKAWCGKANVAVPTGWRDSDGGVAALREEFDKAGIFDFHALDGTALVSWSATVGAWPRGMPRSLDKTDLGIVDADFDAERAKVLAEVESRKREARSIPFNGRKVDPEEVDWQILAEELAANLSRKMLSTPLGTHATLLPARSKTGATSRQGSSGGSHTPSPRAPSQKTDMIGRIGELAVYQWLRDRLPKQNIDAAWKSNNAFPFTGRVGSDSLGYDFEVSFRNQLWQIEVKASLSDPCSFEMGESEVRAGRVAARARSGVQYWIAYVSNVSDPAHTRVEMLPNPMGEEGEAVLNLLGEGLRYGFRRS